MVEFTRPASELPEYAALSYVWGDAEQLVVLKKESLAGFLVEDSEYLALPLNYTIADAIGLASRIGLRYIWIDALCIIQDSPEDKAIQIPQMHQIFSRAELTIVAAYGSDADAGLPGVIADTRGRNYFQMELPEITVLIRSGSKVFVAKENLGIAMGENYLHGSEYLKRAWTYQEGLLSKRVLVFTKSQVYFECDRCTWSEESHWESSEIDFRGWRAIKDPTPFDIWIDALDRRAYNPGDVAKDTTPRNSYSVLLKNYTQRKLRYDEDILNAFSGVLAMVKVWEKTDVFFGLRTKLFGNDLLFNMMSTSPLRFIEKRAKRHASNKFPTWSWTSWRGAIQIANEARHTSHDPIDDLQPCDGVKCYKLTVDEEGNKSLDVINEDGGWRFKAANIAAGEAYLTCSVCSALAATTTTTTTTTTAMMTPIPATNQIYLSTNKISPWTPSRTIPYLTSYCLISTLYFRPSQRWSSSEQNAEPKTLPIFQRCPLSYSSEKKVKRMPSRVKKRRVLSVLAKFVQNPYQKGTSWDHGWESPLAAAISPG